MTHIETVNFWLKGIAGVSMHDGDDSSFMNSSAEPHTPDPQGTHSGFSQTHSMLNARLKNQEHFWI